MNPITKLLNSTNKEDQYIGKVTLLNKNRELFLEHAEYSAPYYRIDNTVLSVMLGEVHRMDIIFDESLIKEMFPDILEKVGGYNENMGYRLINEFL